MYVSDLNSFALEAVIGHGYDVNVELANDAFGWDVDLDGGLLAIAAVFDDGEDDQVRDAGAVYLFEVGDTIRERSLRQIFGHGYDFDIPLDIEDAFGHAVDLEGSTLLIGADKDDGADNSVENAGALYVIDHITGEMAIIGHGHAIAMELDPRDFFGLVAEIDGRCIAVGASGDDGSDNTISGRGAVHLLDRQSLSPIGKIGADYEVDLPLSRFDYSSYFVAMDDDVLLSGAPFSEPDGAPADLDTGEVYLIRGACAALR